MYTADSISYGALSNILPMPNVGQIRRCALHRSSDASCQWHLVPTQDAGRFLIFVASIPRSFDDWIHRHPAFGFGMDMRVILVVFEPGCDLHKCQRRLCSVGHRPQDGAGRRLTQPCLIKTAFVLERMRHPGHHVIVNTCAPLTSNCDLSPASSSQNIDRRTLPPLQVITGTGR
ncbi:hypothetical protein L226DRAFT_50439 [Lentinus tigrinus ALCF2SS1-7]|uniref:uncharacterized protein n=1 Tax=Lentinus tigrinus ALCF2SS1-7 TaxID=1328758 RepID=UPI0011661BFD|nr:hypothetical protein L226DRAFT_50439 [Lentinus tigrinus ALCF2SS1-7]